MDDLSFSARKGRVMGLLGPNGSGKSTTIKMILGLVKPTSGAISLLERSPTERQARSAVGYLPGKRLILPLPHWPGMRAHDGQIVRPARAELDERAMHAVETVGLKNAASRRVGTFTRAMLQRIGLAQAIVHDPDLLIQMSLLQAWTLLARSRWLSAYKT